MSKLKPLTSSWLNEIKSVKHGFFTRNGGVSSGIYESLNCGSGSDDSKENVENNRKRVAEYFSITPEKLISLSQVHGSDVVVIDENTEFNNFDKADAMVTASKNIALGILTADCVPILFANQNNNIIGAAHAGWQGLIKGVVANTIKEMENLGAKRNQIIAAIGPAIGQKSYQVGEEFYERFANHDPDSKDFFRDVKMRGQESEPAKSQRKLQHISNSGEFADAKKDNNKYYFDIKSYAAKTLADLGIENISIIANDTGLQENLFFSNRRRNLRNEPDYGRQLSVIMLES